MLRVIGVGDNFVDHYIDSATMYPGGCSVNFSVYARKMGLESAYCGVFAGDDEAKLIINVLDKLGIDYSHCTFMSDGETGKGTIRLIDGDRIITDDNDGGSVKSNPLLITDELLNYFSTFDVIHSACYGYLEPQLEKIASCGVPVVYDFSDQWGQDRFKQICPNVEIAFISGGNHNEDVLRTALIQAFEYGSSISIATMGKRGAIAYDGKRFYSKAPYGSGRRIVDTMGAGDSFITGFVVSYYFGKKLFAKLTDGQQKSILSPADEEDYYSRLIEYSMCAANLQAIKSCMINGAFGMGVPMPHNNK